MPVLCGRAKLRVFGALMLPVCCVWWNLALPCSLESLMLAVISLCVGSRGSVGRPRVPQRPRRETDTGAAACAIQGCRLRLYRYLTRLPEDAAAHQAVFSADDAGWRKVCVTTKGGMAWPDRPRLLWRGRGGSSWVEMECGYASVLSLAMSDWLILLQLSLLLLSPLSLLPSSSSTHHYCLYHHYHYCRFYSIIVITNINNNSVSISRSTVISNIIIIDIIIDLTNLSLVFLADISRNGTQSRMKVNRLSWRKWMSKRIGRQQ